MASPFKPKNPFSSNPPQQCSPFERVSTNAFDLSLIYKTPMDKIIPENRGVKRVNDTSAKKENFNDDNIINDKNVVRKLFITESPSDSSNKKNSFLDDSYVKSTYYKTQNHNKSYTSFIKENNKGKITPRIEDIIKENEEYPDNDKIRNELNVGINEPLPNKQKEKLRFDINKRERKSIQNLKILRERKYSPNQSTGKLNVKKFMFSYNRNDKENLDNMFEKKCKIHSAKKNYKGNIELYDNLNKPKSFKLYKDEDIGFDSRWQQAIEIQIMDEDDESDEEEILSGKSLCFNQLGRGIDLFNSIYGDEIEEIRIKNKKINANQNIINKIYHVIDGNHMYKEINKIDEIPKKLFKFLK